MKYFLKTMGCRVNQAESIQLEKDLQAKGFQPNRYQPDLVIINSCVVTTKAENRVKKLTRSYRQKWPDSKIFIVGCAADYWQQKKTKINLVHPIPNNQKQELPELLEKKFGIRRVKKSQAIRPKFSPYWKSGRAMVKLQDGCDRFCSYCLVPYLRNNLGSKKIAEVIDEVNWLAKEKKIQEVTLTGINLDLYRPGLTKLLQALLKKTEMPRFRFGSINISAINNELINLYQQEYDQKQTETRLCRHFHIPLQSGSDRILKRMGRPYSTNRYRNLILRLKNEIPGMTFGTDLIIGFPGETEKDFQKSLSLLKKVGFINIHFFRFSGRPGTKAALMISEEKWPEVSSKIVKERYGLAKELAEGIRAEEICRFNNKKLKVLFEKKSKNHQYFGYTDNYLPFRSLSKKDLVGQIKNIHYQFCF